MLIASLSRAAWLAFFSGLVLIEFREKKYTSKLKERFVSFSIWGQVTLLFLGIILIGGGIFLIFILKPYSAIGRLFIWKISYYASIENPWGNGGLGSFAHTYALEQIEYFLENNSSFNERYVAGNPLFAFNELLHFNVEMGFAFTLVSLFIYIYFILLCKKNKNYISMYGLVVIGVFSLASYPFHTWQYLLITALLLFTSIFPLNRKVLNFSRIGIIAMSISFLLPILCVSNPIKQLAKISKAKKEWNWLRVNNNLGIGPPLKPYYDSIFPLLNHDSKYLLDFGIFLNTIDYYNEAEIILSRGFLVSGDAMFLNVRGRNFHKMGNYTSAENVLLLSTYLQPIRTYPYYLLSKLYSDSLYLDPYKLNSVTDSVLYMTPKVYSPAIEQMRLEVKEILRELNKIDYESNNEKKDF